MSDRSKEILQRLFYVDKKLTISNLHKNKNLTGKELKKKINELKQEAEDKEVVKILRESLRLNPVDHILLRRFGEYYCRFIEVNPNLFCVDDFHKIINNVRVTRGQKIGEILEELNQDKRFIERVSFIEKYFELLTSEIPIIVRKFGGLFEILSGNHRGAMAIIKGLPTIKVLCVCDQEKENKCYNLFFHKG